MSCAEPPVLRGLTMRLPSSLLFLLFLQPTPGEAAGMGWMTVDGYGNPTPADHQVNSGGRLPVS